MSKDRKNQQNNKDIDMETDMIIENLEPITVEGCKDARVEKAKNPID